MTAGPIAELLAAGGDIGLQIPLFAGFLVGGAAVTRIRRQYGGPLAGVGLDSLLHRQEVHGVAGLVAYPDRHDHLVIPIDSGLGVVALNPTISSREDMAVGI